MKTQSIDTAMTRRRLIQGCTAMAITSQLSGCASSSSATSTTISAASADTNPQPTPSGPLTAGTLSVAATSVGTMPQGFVGLGYEKEQLYTPLFSITNTNLIALFNMIGPSVLRIGGDSVDETVWSPTGPGQQTGRVSPIDVQAFASFLQATGWKCIYGINLGGSATGATNTTLAAEEVAYVTAALGSSLLGIEIGNECDSWGAAGSFYPGNWSLAQFITLWTTYRNAIAAAVPGTNFVAPASAANESQWTVPFVQMTGKSEVNLITQHYYRGNGALPTSTAALLITPDSDLTGYILPSIQAVSNSSGIPYRIGECNSYYDGGAPGVSNSYATSLWVIDFLMTMALFGASGANVQTGNTASYTPISNTTAGVVTAVNPVFYGLYMLYLAGLGTLYQTTLSAGGLNVTAYAVKTATGLNLIINNKDLTQNLNMAITLPTTANRALLVNMTQLTPGATGPSLTGTTGVTIQGGTIGINATLSPNASYTLLAQSKQLTCYVPALSAVVIQIT